MSRRLRRLWRAFYWWLTPRRKQGRREAFWQAWRLKESWRDG